jgi:hypothetical protein
MKPHEEEKLDSTSAAERGHAAEETLPARGACPLCAQFPESAEAASENAELARLRDEVHQLERRVDALEHRFEHNFEQHNNGRHTQPAAQSVAGGGVSDFALPNAVSVAGRAILGLAGAYLLRALAESGAAPRLLVVAAAVLYAFAWLVFSARTRSQDALTRATYVVTSALILAPLLWEATVRFNVLPPAATSAILIAFVVLGYALATSPIPGTIISVVTFAAVVTSIGLMVRTGDLVPFTAALLALACLVEVRTLGQGMRIPAATAADLAIWLLLFVMTRPGGVPENYKPVAAVASLTLCGLLFLIYQAAVVWRTVVLRHPITAFEASQSMAVFGLAAGGALAVTQGSAAPLIGALCAVACAACYFAAFIRFAGPPRRNHKFFASWGAALGLVASFLILPESLLSPIWSAAAVIATLAGARTARRTLVTHGALYLFAAGLISGFPATILNAFTGAALLAATPALWTMAIAAICCYAACYSTKSGGTPAKTSLVSALFAAVSLGALLILVVLPLVERKPTPSLLAAARTLVTCGLALALRFSGSRTSHRELIWISYAAIALGTVKLLLEDFRQSHPAALAFSLVCYGAMLILLPRLGGRASRSGP